ncbi:MAG: SDR family NAD(P)-dependent oxidoreductase [Microscillaceae bacterium]|nr:SDR family NAD(P)-dependent oxidoreductase [Microscillaceae bacterium]
MTKKIALITGASSGIGWATAEVLAQQGFRLILCGRRAERLETLAQKLLDQTESKTLVFDVRDREAVVRAWASLPEAWQSVHVLINNAGNAHGLDFIQEGQLEDWEAMLDINVKGLLYVSQVVIPQMVARQEGHILNIGSLAGKEVYPKGNVYCASKHAVDALTQGMRMDLYKQGIRVSAVNPGLVATEFSEVRFKGDAERAKKVYEGYAPLLARDIAEVIAFVVSRPAHVNIADLLVLPTAQAASYLVNRGE